MSIARTPESPSRATGTALVGALLAVAALSGCAVASDGANASEGDPNDGAPETGTVSAALVGGTWSAPTSGGATTGYGGGLGPLVVCRSPYDNGQHPGKLWQGACNFGWGGNDIRSGNYTILTDAGYRWENPGKYTNWGSYTYWTVALPPNAVDGGDAGNAAGHARLGICQVYRSQDATWHPGKFYANKCNIAWGGQEIAVAPSAYGDVLVLVK